MFIHVHFSILFLVRIHSKFGLMTFKYIFSFDIDMYLSLGGKINVIYYYRISFYNLNVCTMSVYIVCCKS